MVKQSYHLNWHPWSYPSFPSKETGSLLKKTSREAVLTGRQNEVLELTARGLSNKEIAASLNISEATVKYHVSQILERLHLKKPLPNRRIILVNGENTNKSSARLTSKTRRKLYLDQYTFPLAY